MERAELFKTRSQGRIHRAVRISSAWGLLESLGLGLYILSSCTRLVVEMVVWVRVGLVWLSRIESVPWSA